MRTILGDRPEPLFDTAATRSIEHVAQAALPPHMLMARAGLAVARLSMAIAPHARCVWVACGPGNNGGDGLVAATHLHQWAERAGHRMRVVVTHALPEGEDAAHLPPDARHAWSGARSAGVLFEKEPPAQADLCIDALLGLGASRPVRGVMAEWLVLLRTSPTPVLCVDLPSGLVADTGALSQIDAPTALPIPNATAGPRHTLSLLTLKPGLFTAQGRDAVGRVWFDDLGVTPDSTVPVTAWLNGRLSPAHGKAGMAHASHKGSFGDVVVIGGQALSASGAGMTGAAILAARSALHAGAGRVYLGLLGPDTGSLTTWDPVCPELMFRRPEALLNSELLQRAAIVCGCGGGTSVAAVLPSLLSGAHVLVLDADALNAIAADIPLQTLLTQRQQHPWITVLTPHPLEAARLLGSDTARVMADRMGASHSLSKRFGAICVLKGSGTVITAPEQVPRINPSGNAALATAGTGDVLAGMIGSALAAPGTCRATAHDRVSSAVFQHGWLADHWNHFGAPGHAQTTLVAGSLAQRATPLS